MFGDFIPLSLCVSIIVMTLSIFFNSFYDGELWISIKIVTIWVKIFLYKY